MRQLTNEDIRRSVERQLGDAKKLLAIGRLDEEHYGFLVRQIEHWAAEQYYALTAPK